MTENKYNYFVAAAVISAKLHDATRIAKQLSLTASNARAVALRAGEGAAGFRPLTEFIDQLAIVTIRSSQRINLIAAELSRIAADKFRADMAISRFDKVYQIVADSPYRSSLDYGYERTRQAQRALLANYHNKLLLLDDELLQLKSELRTAVVLSTLSRVEAAQAGVNFRESLNNVADNVGQSAEQIQLQLNASAKLLATLEQEG